MPSTPKLPSRSLSTPPNQMIRGQKPTALDEALLTQVQFSSVSDDEWLKKMSRELPSPPPIAQPTHYKSLFVRNTMNVDPSEQAQVKFEIGVHVARPRASASSKARETMTKVGELCKAYMDYSLKSLGCPKVSGDFYPYTYDLKEDSTRVLKLKKKYNLIRKLYTNATNPFTSKDALTKELKDPLYRALLETHRDGFFVRIIVAIWALICIVPRALDCSNAREHLYQPSFWKSRSETLLDSIEKTLKINQPKVA